ncbi:hypothetical protein DY000_02057854 [Brassica cretica]|uniref:Uncharacterized protein n=1 Tax=Brassica cretica TaxID=69181 RepID=A0ABQ7AAF4_BRACR|nr:hypothetical protein DY000_02057854 [Brassica cretica]
MLAKEEIFGTSKSIGADCIPANSPDTNVKPGGKRLLGQEETSEAGSKKLHKMNSEEDRSSEDQKD